MPSSGTKSGMERSGRQPDTAVCLVRLESDRQGMDGQARRGYSTAVERSRVDGRSRLDSCVCVLRGTYARLVGPVGASCDRFSALSTDVATVTGYRTALAGWYP